MLGGLSMRVSGRTNAIEQLHQIGLAAGNTEVAVTQIESLRHRRDRCAGHGLPLS
jgi:hypothetical protein